MRSRSGEGTLRLALAFAALLGSLSLVIWRQSQALDVLRELDGTRVSRAAVESEKSQQVEQIQRLESRARITSYAGGRWGMRVPSSDEEFVIVLRPGSSDASSDDSDDVVDAPASIVSMANVPPPSERR